MSEDFAIAAASPRTVSIGGRPFLLSRFTPRDLGDLQQYLKEVVPDPRTLARELCRDLPDPVALRIWEDLNAAAADWPPSPMSAEGNRILCTTGEGAARVLWVLLRRHQKAVDLPRARELADEVSFAELVHLIELGFPEPDWLPKATAAPA